jgi:hypothetical protein
MSETDRMQELGVKYIKDGSWKLFENMPIGDYDELIEYFPKDKDLYMEMIKNPRIPESVLSDIYGIICDATIVGSIEEDAYHHLVSLGSFIFFTDEFVCAVSDILKHRNVPVNILDENATMDVTQGYDLVLDATENPRTSLDAVRKAYKNIKWYAYEYEGGDEDLQSTYVFDDLEKIIKNREEFGRVKEYTQEEIDTRKQEMRDKYYDDTGWHFLKGVPEIDFHDILDYVAEDDGMGLQQSIINVFLNIVDYRHPAVPKDIVDKCYDCMKANHGFNEEISAVVDHPNTSAETLLKIANTEIINLVVDAGLHKNASLEVVERVIEQVKHHIDNFDYSPRQFDSKRELAELEEKYEKMKPPPEGDPYQTKLFE